MASNARCPKGHDTVTVTAGEDERGRYIRAYCFTCRDGAEYRQNEDGEIEEVPAR